MKVGEQSGTVENLQALPVGSIIGSGATTWHKVESGGWDLYEDGEPADKAKYGYVHVPPDHHGNLRNLSHWTVTKISQFIIHEEPA